MGTQATLADVAMLAGVSLATASRALSPVKGASVGAELRARVRAAAAELSYAPNAHAQAMRSPATTTVGLIVHDIADPVAAAIASGVLAAAAAAGLIVTIGASGGDADAEVRLFEALRRQRTRAIILAGSRFIDSPAQRWLADEVSACQAGGGRVVTIGQDQLGTDAVVVDNATGARDLAHALWDLGYRRFAVLAGPEQQSTSDQRVTGFRSGLADRGYELPPENTLSSQLSRDGGYIAVRELFETQVPVDCVFAVDDSMAMGALAALRDTGHRVPQEIGLAGFGDIAALRDVVPGLSTVRLPLAEMGRWALELAFAESEHERRGPQLRAVSGTVVLRASTPQRSRKVSA